MTDGRQLNRKPTLDAIFTRVRCACGFEGHRHLFCAGLLAVEGTCPACKDIVNVDMVMEDEGIDEKRGVAIPNRD